MILRRKKKKNQNFAPLTKNDTKDNMPPLYLYTWRCKNYIPFCHVYASYSSIYLELFFPCIVLSGSYLFDLPFLAITTDFSFPLLTSSAASVQLGALTSPVHIAVHN